MYQFSLLSDYGFDADFGGLCARYENWYKDQTTEIKNATVRAFLNRDFAKIWPLMQKADTLAAAPI